MINKNKNKMNKNTGEKRGFNIRTAVIVAATTVATYNGFYGCEHYVIKRASSVCLNTRLITA